MKAWLLGVAAGVVLKAQDPSWFVELDKAFHQHIWNVDEQVEAGSLDGLDGVYKDAASLYQDLPPEGVLDLLRKVRSMG